MNEKIGSLIRLSSTTILLILTFAAASVAVRSSVRMSCIYAKSTVIAAAMRKPNSIAAISTWQRSTCSRGLSRCTDCLNPISTNGTSNGHDANGAATKKVPAMKVARTAAQQLAERGRCEMFFDSDDGHERFLFLRRHRAAAGAS